MQKLFGCLLITIVAAITISAQVPSADTLQKIRKLEAENNSLKNEGEIKDDQIAYWQASSKRWQGLYNSSNQNTDENLGEALKTREMQIENLRVQHNADQARIDSLERRVSSLKRQRFYAGVIGAGTGFAGGYFAGRQSGNSGTTIINQTPPPAAGLTFRF